jgi:hypothetical protein
VSVRAAIIKAAKPKAQKACAPITRYVVISVNIVSGYVDVVDTGDVNEAKRHFANRGDPATWRGLQIIQVDTNGGNQ